ncbi:MAG: Uma2 family endonuclease [Pseudanabaena sp.]
MTVTTARKMTFEEYLTYDDGTDKLYEFNDGELVEVTPATGFHNDLMMFFAFFLQTEIKRFQYPYCVRVNSTEIFNGKRTRRPDVLVMTLDQRESLKSKPDILREACPLVIEIVSPTCRSVDTVEKREEYAQFGNSEYWILDFLLETFTVLNLVNGVYIEKVYRESDHIISNVFPEISLTMSQVLESV